MSTLTEKVDNLEGLSVALLDQDVRRFVAGRGLFRQIKRWIMTREDVLEKELVADYIVGRIRNYLLDHQQDL